MKKQYAFVEYGGQVLSIETRCSGFKKSEIQPGELAIEDIIHPDLVNRYVEITAETGDAQIGMLWSDGKFIPNPEYPEGLSSVAKRVDELEKVQNAQLGV